MGSERAEGARQRAEDGTGTPTGGVAWLRSRISNGSVVPQEKTKQTTREGRARPDTSRAYDNWAKTNKNKAQCVKPRRTILNLTTLETRSSRDKKEGVSSGQKEVRKPVKQHTSLQAGDQASP